MVGSTLKGVWSRDTTKVMMVTKEYDFNKAIGDWTHCFLILANTLFTYAVIVHYESEIFDPMWQLDGFCVANKDIPYWNSHDLCLYFDTIASIVLGILFLFLKDSAGMEKVDKFLEQNIFGIFAHGVGHGYLSKGIRDGQFLSEESTLTSLQGNDIIQYISTFSALMFFCFFMLKTAMPEAPNQRVLFVSIIFFLGLLNVNSKFSFTYVQTVLFLAYSLSQLWKPNKEKKEFTYPFSALALGIPIFFMGLLESTSCSRAAVDKIGGHLIYDGTIPVTVFIFYVVCWVKAQHGKGKAT